VVVVYFFPPLRSPEMKEGPVPVRVHADRGGIAVGGNVTGGVTIGITLEQYEAGLKKRSDEIRAEEEEKRIQLQKKLKLIERATGAEKDKLRSQIDAIQAEKRALEAESKVVADRLTNLQASYDEVVQKLDRHKKLAEVTNSLVEVAPHISKDLFVETVAMLSHGDVVGADRKFVEIEDTLRKMRDETSVRIADTSFKRGCR